MKNIKNDFPIFQRKLSSGKPLIYLDSTATSQKPNQVINAELNFYEKYYANVHRGIYELAAEATEEYEKARSKIAKFINAKPEEIIFTRGATESLNLAATILGSTLKKGDKVISSVMEHHSNIVPWQFLREQKGIQLDFVDITDDGFLLTDQFDSMLTENTKVVTLTGASNVLGTLNPVKELAKKTHNNGALFILDGAALVPHQPVDVKELDCDFLAFSGHKMLGPTGIGILYGKQELLEKLPPYQGGGDMIKEVRLEKTTYNELPYKYEAGTPNIAGTIGLGAAVDYLQKIGMEKVAKHEEELTKYALEILGKIKEITIYGPKDYKKRQGVIAFNYGDIHAHDLSSLLDTEGIEIRSGHHCTMPLHTRLGIPASARASFYVYNTIEEIDIFAQALQKVTKIFR